MVRVVRIFVAARINISLCSPRLLFPDATPFCSETTTTTQIHISHRLTPETGMGKV